MCMQEGMHAQTVQKSIVIIRRVAKKADTFHHRIGLLLRGGTGIVSGG